MEPPSHDTDSGEPDRLPGEKTLPGELPAAPPCPFCSGTETELVSAFGAHASVSACWCRTCGSPFEMMKWRARPR